MSSPTDLLSKKFEFLSKCQGLASKLWANPECKAMFHHGLESMYHFTAEGQGLSWELGLAAQVRQKWFLQEIEGRLIAPLPPVANRRHNRRHTGNKRKGKASAQHAVLSTKEENSPISIPNREKNVIQRCSSKHEGNSSIPVLMYSVPPGMRALQLRVKKDGTLPTNPTDYFNIIVDTCWRANTRVLTGSIT